MRPNRQARTRGKTGNGSPATPVGAGSWRRHHRRAHAITRDRIQRVLPHGSHPVVVAVPLPAARCQAPAPPAPPPQALYHLPSKAQAPPPAPHTRRATGSLIAWRLSKGRRGGPRRWFWATRRRRRLTWRDVHPSHRPPRAPRHRAVVTSRAGGDVDGGLQRESRHLGPSAVGDAMPRERRRR